MPNTYACKLVFPIQSKCSNISAEGLHFSAFHFSKLLKLKKIFNTLYVLFTPIFLSFWAEIFNTLYIIVTYFAKL